MSKFAAGLREILTNFQWAIDPTIGTTLFNVVRQNIAEHKAFTSDGDSSTELKNALLVLTAEERRKVKSQNPEAFISGSLNAELLASHFDARTYVGNAEYILKWRDVQPDDTVINLVYLDGPITRNGMCNYGSREIRDIMEFCSKQPQCIGHLIIIDSPGGSTAAISDFEMAFAYARNVKQPLVGLIDGLCASAALWAGLGLDELYFMHPENEIGSVGVYGSYFDMKDGTKNMVTKETYHEVYASQSIDKNNWVREMRKGNSKPLQDDLDKCAEKFMNFVKERRPNTPDEWLHGIVVECKDTVGIWTNGQATEDDCLQRIINLYNNNH